MISSNPPALAHFQGISGNGDSRSGGHSLNRFHQGIFTKHLQYYIDHAGDAARAKYGVFLTIQSSGVHFYATGSDNVSGIEAVTAYAVNSVNDNGRWQYPGSVWYAQNNGGSIFSPRSMASGLEAHIAAAKVGLDF